MERSESGAPGSGPLNQGWPGRPALLDVDLSAVAENVRSIRDLIGPRCELMAVVKADGYGLGAAWVAQAALAGGATRLGVACVDEGVELRKAGFSCPILVVGYSAPSEARSAVENGLSLVIHRVVSVEALELAALAMDVPQGSVAVHIKVDTGMGQFGCLPEESLPLAQFVQRCPHLRLEGLMTHFADAEAEDLSFSKEQLARFQRVLRQCEVNGVQFEMVHAANSAATVALPESRFDMVRVGIMLGGHYPSIAASKALNLKPAITLRARLVRVTVIPAGASVGYGRAWVAQQVSTVGLASIGYADGYKRVFANRGVVLVQGRRCPVIGRISMDQITVNLSSLSDASEGDEVVLCGRQGNQFLGLDELAQLAGTNTYEMLTGLAPRLPRRYIREGEVVGVCNLLGCTPGDEYLEGDWSLDNARG